MATKPTPRAQLKATVVDPITTEPVSSISEDIAQLLAKHGAPLPSGARMVASFVASFCVGAGIGYVGGMALEFLVLGALTLTGSAFLAFAVYVLGLLLLLMSAYFAGGWVGNLVLRGGVSKCYQKYSTAFSFTNREVTA